jgi:hypothetical protein
VGDFALDITLSVAGTGARYLDKSILFCVLVSKLAASELDNLHWEVVPNPMYVKGNLLWVTVDIVRGFGLSLVSQAFLAKLAAAASGHLIDVRSGLCTHRNNMYVEISLATLLFAPFGYFWVSNGYISEPRWGLIMVG